MATKITRDIIESYLSCKYKGHLKLTGASGTQSDYETMTRAAATSSREQAVGPTSSRYFARSPIRSNVSGRMRDAWSIAARDSLGMKAPWTERRRRADRLAVWPCQTDPLKTMIDPAGPHASTPSWAPVASFNSSGSRGHRCEPGTKRVAPFPT